MSVRRIVSNGSDRVVVQGSICSGLSFFEQFHEENVTFVDKSLTILAFLGKGAHQHLILRPKRCGKSYTLSMIRLSAIVMEYLNPFSTAETLRDFLQRDFQRGPKDHDINDSPFKGMAIADEVHREFVSKNFKQYPVLLIDLKVSLLVFVWKQGVDNSPRMSVPSHTIKCCSTSTGWS